MFKTFTRNRGSLELHFQWHGSGTFERNEKKRGEFAELSEEGSPVSVT